MEKTDTLNVKLLILVSPLAEKNLYEIITWNKISSIFLKLTSDVIGAGEGL